MTKTLTLISPNGEYLATSSPDGILKIWEVASDILKQEYAHSTHLTATSSCLEWAPMTVSGGEKKSKKRRTSTGDALSKLELIAVGTTSGDLFLYSVVTGDLHTQLTGGHTDVVNSVCWNSRGTLLYSCSADQQIVEWNVAKATVNQKWKGGEGSIQSIALCGSERHILTASKTITLYDIESKQVLKAFSGHKSSIFSLVPVAGKAQVNGTAEHNGGDDQHLDVDGSYFMTAAEDDRIINVWQVKLNTKKGKKALGTFALPEEPKYMTVSQPTVPGQPIIMLAITRTGHLYVFEHVMNGPCKTPLEPRYSVQISTEKGSSIPIIAARVERDGDDADLLLAHGNLIKPTFEHLPYSSLKADTCLKRQAPAKTSAHLQTSISKVKTPAVSKDMTVVMSGQSVVPKAAAKARASSSIGSSKGASKSHKALSVLEEMEKSAAASEEKEDVTDIGKLASDLMNGLQSQDKHLLNRLFLIKHQETVDQIVKQLRINFIVPLAEELTRKLKNIHSQTGLKLMRWVRALLLVHFGYLTTVPQVIEKLLPLYQALTANRLTIQQVRKLSEQADVLEWESKLKDQDQNIPESQFPIVYQSDEENLGDVSDEEDDDEAMSSGDEEDRLAAAVASSSEDGDYTDDASNDTDTDVNDDTEDSNDSEEELEQQEKSTMDNSLANGFTQDSDGSSSEGD